MLREKLKKYGLNHEKLLKIYQNSLGKIKTKYLFDARRRTLQEKGGDIIGVIDRALSEAGAQYFIDSGTLLGYIRDKKPVAGDMDIDFGVWFDDHFTPEILITLMGKLGFKKIHEFRFAGLVQELTFAKGIIHIDFFRHTETNDESWFYIFYREISINYPSDNHYSVLLQKRIHIPGLQRFSIGNYETYIPVNAEAYLESAYTENWRTPDPNWHYTMCPGCIWLDELGTLE